MERECSLQIRPAFGERIRQSGKPLAPLAPRIQLNLHPFSRFAALFALFAVRKAEWLPDRYMKETAARPEF
jgi:hypothetical protein